MATDLASLRWATVPQADFSTLGNLQRDFIAARREGNRDRVLAGINPNDPQSLATLGMKLVQAGDTQGGLAAAQLARQNTNDDWQRQYQGGMLDIARQNANRQEVPTDIKKLQAAGIKPGTPEAAKALFPRTDTPISATDKKAIFTAEDAIPQLTGTVEALNRALDLNSKTFTGYTAGVRGAIGAKMPGGGMLVDRDAAMATEEWSKIMGPEALKTMADTLKGATTDFELRKFTEMLADPSTPPEVRKGVIQRMKTLAERKLELSQSRVKDLRGGSYFQGQRQQQGGPVRVNSPQERDALAPGTPYIAPDGSLRTKQ